MLKLITFNPLLSLSIECPKLYIVNTYLFQSSSEFKIFNDSDFTVDKHFQSSSEFKFAGVRVLDIMYHYAFNPLLSLSLASA